jgi:ATP-dependent DNA helicase UvrD/PcrA
MELTFLEELNERQREAVTAPEGPTLVLAGAGSGKTRVIVYRIAYLIAARRVEADAILAVTFTNKAAEEMRRRVRELLGELASDRASEPSSDPAVHTFHALSLRLLRRFGDELGLPRGFTVYGEDDRRALLRRVCRELNVSERELPLSRVAAAVSASKNDAFAPSMAGPDPFLRAVTAVAERYQRELESNGALDFDDLLLRALELLECSARAQSYAARRFRHVLVDEYQDTNRIQYRLLRLLAPHGNVFVVGDEDQSIYNFRGADLRNILDFERDFAGGRVVKLEVNYRSTGAILRAAGGVIRNNRERKGKNLVASLEEGELLVLREAEDDREEAAQVAETILELRRRAEGRVDGGPGAIRVAVLLRTHAQTRVLEEELVRRSIPHQVVGGLRFYERREIKDALSYLRLLLNRSDDGSFRRVVNVPPRGVGPATVALIEHRARERRSSLWEASLELLGGDELSGRARLGLRGLADLVEGLTPRLPPQAPSRALQMVLDTSGLLATIEAEGESAARDRKENLDQLVSSAVEYEQREEAPSLSGFLDAVRLLTDADSIETPLPCLLMTIHAAKGLEFDAVFLPGLEEGLFPHVRASGDKRALEEERRLFYVALTRARKRLFLSYARARRASYQMSARPPSRFLSEIPPEVLKTSSLPVSPDSPGPASSKRRSAIRPGAVVAHKIFGEGRVVDASGSGRDRKVTVIFDKAGRKRLLEQYAGLELIR